MKKLALILLACAAASAAKADSYVRQATFTTSFSTVAAMDTDSLGSLYVLGLAPGSTTYQVHSYTMPAFTPQFSFDTKVSSPGAFAVEASGVIDVLETKGTITLKRFSNTGFVIGQSTYSIRLSTPILSGDVFYPPVLFSEAIDKINGRLYIGYQDKSTGSFCLSIVGNCTPQPLTNVSEGIAEYDFNGNQLSSFPSLGLYLTIGGNASAYGCYNPTAMTTDPQGNLYVADSVCQQTLSYSTAGIAIATLNLSGVPKSIWTDSSSNLYVTEPVCGLSGCSSGVAQLNTSGTVQTSFVTNATVATAGDSRLLYMAAGSTLMRWIDASAPSVPVETGPIGYLIQHSSTVVFAWQTSSDSDGDAISYGVYAGTSTNALVQISSTNQTSATSSLALGATYFWEVVAENVYDGVPVLQSSAPVVSFDLNLQDTPPGAFTVAGGTGTLCTRTTAELLVWNTSIDQYGDTLNYVVSVGTSPKSLAVVQTSTATSYLLTFQFGTTYYWNVAAVDPYGYSTAMSSGPQSFLPMFLNPPPSVVQIAAPPVVATMRSNATVSWQAVSTPEGDPVSYTLNFGNSANNIAPLAQISASTTTGIGTATLVPLATQPATQAQVNGSTISVTLSNLDYNLTYYVQIQAADPYGSTSITPVQTFSLTALNGFPAAYNYPNPFSPNQGGTNIVFNAPASGFSKATVEVFSEWQQLLFKQDYYNIPPGVSQVPFNGLDRHGRAFFNGSYICRVKFSGPDQVVTFFMAVVK